MATARTIFRKSIAIARLGLLVFRCRPKYEDSLLSMAWSRQPRFSSKIDAQARIGIVVQHFNLFGHLTALKNVIEAPPRVYGEDAERARAKGMGLLTMVGLANHAHHLPHRLSGG